MRPHVDLEVRRLDERLLAELAAERPLAGVYAHVRPQVAEVDEPLVADGADEGPLAGVNSDVRSQIVRALELFTAHITGKCPLHSSGASPGPVSTISRRLWKQHTARVFKIR